MSELTTEQTSARTLRRHWLATASTLILAASVLPVGEAFAAGLDEDNPTIWIELGGQLERVAGGQDRFMPPFVSDVIAAGFESPAVAQTPPRYSFGGEAKVSLLPKGSDWVVSLGLRYGRSNGKKHTHEQTSVETSFQLLGNEFPLTEQLASDSKTQENESHSILDFQAGKDVGFGVFGRGSTLVVSGGVRFAEFTSKSKDNLIARPDYGFVPKLVFGLPILTATRYDFHGIAENERSFRGIGPSLAWDSSTPIVDGDDGGFSFDWGVNAAVLFGRQKSVGHHQTTAYHYTQKYGASRQPRYVLAYQPNSADHARSRSVIVPNIGGFAGISLRWPNAKVSLGYRGDFFFGAMDGGVDTRVTKDRAFYGPFATVSIGL
jgi:hypothetical protein